MTFRFALLAVGIFIFISSCSLFGDDSTSPEELPIQTLRGAPVQVTIDKKDLTLNTFMWRDFQPVAPPDGEPLRAIFFIRTKDSTAVPEGLEATAAWVVHEKNVWSTHFTGEDPPPSERKPYQLYEVARDGPKFGPEVRVDAAVRLKEHSGESHLLRAKNQLIKRTE